MDCRKVREVMFLFVDNEMDGTLLVIFREHLSHCPGCAAEIDHTRKILSVFRERCRRAPAPIRLRKRILTSLPHRTAGLREHRE